MVPKLETPIRLSERPERRDGGRMIEIESTKDLDATFRRILDEFRQRCLISYSPQGVTTGGWDVP
jgi:hypothetical protein